MSVFNRIAAVFRPEPKTITPFDRYGPENNGGGTYRLTGSKFPGALGGYRALYDLDHEALRSRSRMAYWESTQARALFIQYQRTIAQLNGVNHAN